MLGERLHPLGLDLRDRAREQPRGLDELGGHHPLRRLLRQRGAGEDREPGVARAQEIPRLGVVRADLREQPRQQREVHLVGVSRIPRTLWTEPLQADRPRDLAELRDQVLPLPDPQVVQVLLGAQLPEPGGGELPLLLAQVAPQVEVSHKI